MSLLFAYNTSLLGDRPYSTTIVVYKRTNHTSGLNSLAIDVSDLRPECHSKVI